MISRDNCQICNNQHPQSLLKRNVQDSSVKDFLQNYYKNRIDLSLLSDWDYEILKCNNCGFIWQKNILGDELSDVLYNQWISPEESLNKVKNKPINNYLNYTSEMAVIKDLFPNKLPHQIKILDYGMGWGAWALMAQAFGYDVYGLEVADSRIQYAQEKGIKVINPQDLKNHKFDYINSYHVFEHIDQPLENLKKLNDILEDQGVINLTVPNGLFIERKLNENFKAAKNALHPLEHINCFKPSVFRAMAGRAGFNVVKHIHLKQSFRNLFLKIFNLKTSLYLVKK